MTNTIEESICLSSVLGFITGHLPNSARSIPRAEFTGNVTMISCTYFATLGIASLTVLITGGIRLLRQREHQVKKGLALSFEESATGDGLGSGHRSGVLG
jgi:hypothetical protein